MVADLSRLCLHTITNRPWSVEIAIEQYSRAGIGGVTVWRQALAGRDPVAVGRRIREAGMAVISLCRGGFFTGATPESRQAAIEENLRAIDEAAALGTPLVVLVCGATPGQPLEVSRQQIVEGIAAVLPHARACDVRLGIEPLHPMYADCRSAIVTLAQATDASLLLASPFVGVVVDVYHLWWDPNLAAEIARCAQHGKLFAFHICDWKAPTSDLLYDRGIMGEGCIPLKAIRDQVLAAGFAGFHEVEIFSHSYWQMDQNVFLEKIIAAYRAYMEG